MFLQRPHRRLVKLSIILITLLTTFCYVSGNLSIYFWPKFFIHAIRGTKILSTPPDWSELYQWEDMLPQHSLRRPFPEGSHGRYVKFSNQIQRLGWNNVFNELLMNTHLAYESKRAYVFSEYQWKPDYHPWIIPPVSFAEQTRFPRTPLNALISGPTAGGSWEKGDSAPRSVSERWFDIVCPPKDRRLIHTRDVKPAVAEASGAEVFNHWKNILLNAPEQCVEIIPAPLDEDSYPQTFDLWLWGNTRILSLWETFSNSPSSRLLQPSSIVQHAIRQNEHLFSDSRRRGIDSYSTMLAMHVRLGDFKQACLGLARWNSTFYSWNQLPFLPDKFVPPPGGSVGKNTPSNIAQYLEHCQPPLEGILGKIKQARLDSERPDTPLDTIFLLTNEKTDMMGLLKDQLIKDGWTRVVVSMDLKLSEHETDVGMAIDMEIARRAAVFIGNGWSSFTSNIVHQRLVSGKDAMSNRFW